ncbi:MAG: helix-turn-helix domain-containing protein [Pararhodobacter sp.]
MAERAGLSRARVNRRLVPATGLAPIDSLHRLREDGAKAPLQETGATIHAIGWQVGYDEPAALRPVFRKLTCLLPGN